MLRRSSMQIPLNILSTLPVLPRLHVVGQRISGRSSLQWFRNARVTGQCEGSGAWPLTATGFTSSWFQMLFPWWVGSQLAFEPSRNHAVIQNIGSKHDMPITAITYSITDIVTWHHRSFQSCYWSYQWFYYNAMKISSLYYTLYLYYTVYIWYIT